MDYLIRTTKQVKVKIILIATRVILTIIMFPLLLVSLTKAISMLPKLMKDKASIPTIIKTYLLIGN